MKLTIPAPLLVQLRNDLVKEDDLERFAYLHCGQLHDDLLVSGYETVPDDNLDVMERGACRPDIKVERNHVASCIDNGHIPVMTHSHPFSTHPGFSGIDVATMDDYRDWLTGLYPDTPFAFAVIGTHGLETTAYNAEQAEFVDLPVDVLGAWTLDNAWTVSTDPTVTGNEASTELDVDRYDRNIRAITEDGQHELATTAVGIVGCGGIGSLLCEELARLGVQDFTLIDPDIVEASNLPRLYGTYDHHVGRPKVEVMKEFLWRLQPDANVETVQERVEDASNQLDDVDVMLAGVDQVSARSFLNEYAVRTLTPYIDAGSIIHTDDDRGDQMTAMHGYIHVIVPGVTACFDCLGRGNPDQERLEQLSEDEREHEVEQGYVDEATLAPEPAIIHLNSSVASKAVSEFVKVVTGFAEPASFLRVEDLVNELVELATSPSATCVTCGDDGVLGHGHPDVADDPIDDEVDDVDESELPA